ncbi:MAG TPA: SURF1 family protein [Actinotalea sp.]|nr:SURF1 family protein [Actinotalea sp.]
MAVPGPVLRRWAATLAVAAVVAAGCVTAGVWQWGRHVARSAEVAVVLEYEGSDPVPIGQVLTAGEALPADQVWRPTVVEGRYLEPTVLLRNRPVGGAAGYHVLAGFAVDEGLLAGTVLVLDRGWVPPGPDGSAPATVPDLPVGTVDVVARLRADERPSDREAPAGQVQALNAEQVRLAADGAWAAAATLPATGAVVTEDGASPAGLGDLEPPSTDLGSHLSYAFQWWVFALGSLGGAVVLLRRDAREESGGTERATPARPRRRATAEQEEDALLDAQADAHAAARDRRATGPADGPATDP